MIAFKTISVFFLYRLRELWVSKLLKEGCPRIFSGLFLCFVISWFFCGRLAYSDVPIKEFTNYSSLLKEGKDLRDLMNRAFFQAFSDPEAFRSSRLFDALGYAPEQVKQLVEVTPKPASLFVEFTNSEPQTQKFDMIRVIAKKIHYYGLLIDHGVFEFPHVELDLTALSQNKLIFLSVGRVSIETSVSENDILKLFDKFSKARKLTNLRLRIKKDGTILTGKINKGILVMAFKVIGNSEINGVKTIKFNCRRMILNGLPLPRPIIQNIFNQINPVFDARNTWLQLEFVKIFAEDGFVRSCLNLLGPGQSPSLSSNPRNE